MKASLRLGGQGPFCFPSLRYSIDSTFCASGFIATLSVVGVESILAIGAMDGGRAAVEFCMGQVGSQVRGDLNRKTTRSSGHPSRVCDGSRV